MSQDNIIDLSGRGEISDPLTELLRSGAHQLICQAVEAELEGFMAGYAGQKTSRGHAAVVRNGHHPEREIQTGIGPVSIRVPKVRSKSGQPVTFRQALVPPYIRKSRSLEAALSWLYLKGISSGEMAGALKVLIGPAAKGLSASTVSRLKKVWGQEYQNWREEPLDKDQWV